jgi:glycosyltransferase involved in cell wall biosynthesis
VYQPAAVIVHYEGQTAGRDLSEGMKRHQVVNQKTFARKWQAALDEQAAFGAFFAARDRAPGGTYLVLDNSVPMHDKDAGSHFMFVLRRELRAAGHRVIFWPYNRYRMPRYCDELQQLGIEVRYGTQDLDAFLRERGSTIDAALVYRTHVAEAHVDTLRRHGIRVAVFFCDLESLRESRRLIVEGSRGDAASVRSFEQTEQMLIAAADHVVVHSVAERDHLAPLRPASMQVFRLPLPTTIASTTAFDRRSGLLFVGSIHPPNVDAVRFFVDAIRPLIAGRIDNPELTIAGEVGQIVSKFGDPSALRITGHVPALDPYFDRARVFVAPLRYGAGLKGKIIDALVRGVPVVTTTVGAEGIGLEHGITAMIADDAAAFADAIVRLYTDRALWEGMRDRAAEHARATFGAESFRASMRELLAAVAPEARSAHARS